MTLYRPRVSNLLSGCLFGIWSWGCDPVPEVDSEREIPETNRAIAFRVNGHPIYREVFDYLFEQSIEQQVAMSRMSGSDVVDITLTEDQEKKLRTRIRDQLAKEELEFQMVIERGYSTPAEFTAEVQAEMRKLQPAMEQVIKNRLVDEMLETEFQTQVTEESLRSYYQSHLIQYQTDVVLLQQLTVSDGQLGMDIKQQVSDGASFTTMVQTHSIDRFQQQEGRPLGNEPVSFDTLSQVLPQKFVAALRERQTGEMIGPTMVEEDTFVLLYVESRESILPRFEDVASQVQNDAKTDFKAQFTKELWSDVVITDDGSTGIQQETQP